MWYAVVMDRDSCLIYKGDFYIKKSDKLPSSEKNTALKNMAAYKQAVSERNNKKGQMQ